MALDKQRILNELGSVMNQLQRADCGCMGKLFSNPAQGTPITGYSGCNYGSCQYHGNCTHNYSNQEHVTPCAGEPFPAMNAGGHMNRHCMGSCNPAKLYLDTYNYLNHNVMQPAVNEVYEDLKSITPANTIMNNPVASQMGKNLQNPTIQGNLGSFNQVPTNMFQSPGNENMNSMPMENSMPPGNAGVAQQQMGQMGGMGPQITNMMMGDSKPWQATGNNMPRQGAQTTDHMMMDTHQFAKEQVGGMSLNNPASIQQAQYNPGNVGKSKMYQEICSPSESFGYQPTGNMGTNQVVPHTTAGQGMANVNPPAQHMATSNQNPYGQHSAGILKFNEMFPGITRKDLGFDPMAIAVQMNPANHQRAAMENIYKLMDDNKGTQKTFDTGHLQPVIAGANQIAANIAQQLPNQGQQNLTLNQQNTPPTDETENQQITPGQYQTNYPNTGMQQQQVYTSLADASIMPQHQIQQGQVQPNQMKMLDPNVEVSDDRNRQEQSMIKEPILPVDTSRNQYNTLGQPIEMLSAKMYHQPVMPNLPQTLSPQPIPSNAKHYSNSYSNVKNTVSKTAIAGNRPVGRNPSKSQLQHIYNQYKGSQSVTQQNINMNNQGARFSEGNFNVASTNQTPPRQVPIESNGGDTMIRNQMAPEQMIGNVQKLTGQIGDAPVASKPNEYIPEKDLVTKQSKYRNGLQDMVFTSYPTSAVWSFHGDNRPYSQSRSRNYR